MAAIYLTVVGNLEPSIEITLLRKKVAIPLTGCTVNFIIQNTKTKAITNTGHQLMDFVGDPALGIVAYSVQTGDWDDPSIDYRCEVQIIHENSKPEIIYDQLIVNPRPALTPIP